MYCEIIPPALQQLVDVDALSGEYSLYIMQTLLPGARLIPLEPSLANLLPLG